MNIWLSLLLWITYLLSLYFSIFWLLIFLENASGFFKKSTPGRHRNPLVTIIVPCKNEENTVAGTLQSIINLDYPSDRIETIVICNATTDNTISIVRNFITKHPGKNIKLIYQEKPGKGKALNRGLSIANGEYFACLDADSYVEPQTLSKMIMTFENSKPNTVIVTPAMKIKAPTNMCQRLQRIEYILSIMVSRLMAILDCQYVAPGPFSVYKTDTIRSIGGFDEDNITEDMEIAYRAQHNHLRITHCPEAWVYTVGPESARQLYRQRNRWFKGGLLNAIKYRSMLGNKAYGDFGILQMSINLLLFFFSMTAILFFLYYLIWPLIDQFYNLYLIGFDIWPLITHLKLTFSLLYIDIEKVFVANCIMIITLTFLWLSHKNAHESLKKTSWTIVPYIFAYYLVLSCIALIVLAETAVSKKQEW